MSGEQVPKEVTKVPSDILQPAQQWKDQSAFNQSLRHLAMLYADNFEKFSSGGGFVSESVASDICSAGPKLD